MTQSPVKMVAEMHQMLVCQLPINWRKSKKKEDDDDDIIIQEVT